MDYNVCTPIGKVESLVYDQPEPVYLCPNHVENGIYILGKSGSGKTTFVEHLIYDNMKKGRGLTLFDFHGDLKNRILSLVPSERVSDVIYIDPTDETHVVGLNILGDIDPKDRDTYTSALFEIFYALWGPEASEASWGPRLAGILKNSIKALTYVPGATILGIERMLTDSYHHSGLLYRDYVLNHVKDPTVIDFWRKRFEKWPADVRTQAIEAVLNKWQELISHEGIRHILSQPQAKLNIRQAIEDERIIIVNLAKGEIGSRYARTFASLVTVKVFQEVLSTIDIENPKERTPHYLYLDEVQNLETTILKHILSEARKFKLSLAVAHQFTEQLEPDVFAAILGNMKAASIFSVGGRDVDALAKHLAGILLSVKIESEFGTVYDGAEDFETAVRVARTMLASTPEHQALTWFKEGSEDYFYELLAEPPLKCSTPHRARRVREASRREWATSREIVEAEVLKFLNVDMSPRAIPTETAPRGKPEVSVQSSNIYFNKAFCYEHDFKRGAYVQVLYSKTNRILRFRFSETKEKGMMPVQFRDGAAHISHGRIAATFNIQFKRYLGKYSSETVIQNTLQFEQIRLAPSQ